MRWACLLGLLLVVFADVAKADRTAVLYERLWRQASPYLGAEGQPSPYYKVVRGEDTRGYGAYVGDGPEYQRAVYLSNKMARRLGRRPQASDPKQVAKRERRGRREARNLLLHEWAHVYQGPIFSDYSAREGAADKFANQVSKRIFNKASGGGYGSARKAYVRKYGQRHWRREQFGDNYGRDPRTISSYPVKPPYSNPSW